MSDRQAPAPPDAPPPELPPEPGTARAVRQGRISGRVFLVLAVSLTLAVVLMALSYFLW
jgi:hypothetical protein